MGTSQYIAEITLFAGTFAPRGSSFCQGQILSIQQNSALFSLLGTTYGGNGTQTFALPDLRGRVPIQQGTGPGLSNYQLGQQAGTESTTLNVTNMPAHNHVATLKASTVKATLQTAAAGVALGRAQDSTGTVAPLIYAPAGSAPGQSRAAICRVGSPLPRGFAREIADRSFEPDDT